MTPRLSTRSNGRGPASPQQLDPDEASASNQQRPAEVRKLIYERAG
ncbi:MAG TPA: hypothetical protein VFR66_02980 [Burkholderiales bacterium]|nr:hypothetical protein [Burkholderiales bacterium]